MTVTERLQLAYLLALAGDARSLAQRLDQVDQDHAAALPPAPAPGAIVGRRSVLNPRTGERTTVDIRADGQEVPDA